MKTGKFESTNGTTTVFTRTDRMQEYFDEKGVVDLRRFLLWRTADTYGLVDEKAVMENNNTPGSTILVRIISWDEDEYVCQWVAGKYTDTQDYKKKK
jgi:hypothetical protein